MSRLAYYAAAFPCTFFTLLSFTKEAVSHDHSLMNCKHPSATRTIFFAGLPTSGLRTPPGAVVAKEASLPVSCLLQTIPSLLEGEEVVKGGDPGTHLGLPAGQRSLESAVVRHAGQRALESAIARQPVLGGKPSLRPPESGVLLATANELLLGGRKRLRRPESAVLPTTASDASPGRRRSGFFLPKEIKRLTCCRLCLRPNAIYKPPGCKRLHPSKRSNLLLNRMGLGRLPRCRCSLCRLPGSRRRLLPRSPHTPPCRRIRATLARASVRRPEHGSVLTPSERLPAGRPSPRRALSGVMAPTPTGKTPVGPERRVLSPTGRLPFGGSRLRRPGVQAGLLLISCRPSLNQPETRKVPPPALGGSVRLRRPERSASPPTANGWLPCGGTSLHRRERSALPTTANERLPGGGASLHQLERSALPSAAIEWLPCGGASLRQPEKSVLPPRASKRLTDGSITLHRRESGIVQLTASERPLSGRITPRPHESGIVSPTASERPPGGRRSVSRPESMTLPAPEVEWLRTGGSMACPLKWRVPQRKERGALPPKEGGVLLPKEWRVLLRLEREVPLQTAITRLVRCRRSLLPTPLHRPPPGGRPSLRRPKGIILLLLKATEWWPRRCRRPSLRYTLRWIRQNGVTKARARQSPCRLRLRSTCHRLQQNHHIRDVHTALQLHRACSDSVVVVLHVIASGGRPERRGAAKATFFLVSERQNVVWRYSGGTLFRATEAGSRDTFFGANIKVCGI